uniref:Nudix hydrolase domain-containing protein n=1 Tax=Monopterus albus TaxID=43700 RepID=A0A3Q3JQ61_MONAL
MDPEVSVLLHCAAWRGLLESQVQVELSERHTDPPLERQIEETWTERVSKEPWLFNGAKFRLHSFCLAFPKYPSTSTRPLLTLRLGLTCYKDYLGTNWSCRVEELRQRGEAEFSDPLALLSQPLGVGAILCTDDGQVVLIRRSQRVAEAGGLLDIPGGHPEPKVNIPLSSLREPILLGVALNHTSAGRPSAEFYVSCSLTSDEVRKLYWKGGAEASESTDIVFLNSILTSVSPLWSELCPSAKGAVLLYQTVLIPEDGLR